MSAASPKKASIDIHSSQSRVKPKGRRWTKILTLLVLLVGGALIALATWPTQADFAGDESTAGVIGSGGLKRDFPSMVLRGDNPMPASITDPRVELGRQLFFDPILSGGNDISCAHCHHPDLGFADGRGLAMGKGGTGIGPDRINGTVIRRGAPTLWNATFNHLQFWDGRAADLEEQARSPIVSEIEMNENPDTLIKELQAIPEYVSHFEKAFPESGDRPVSFDNLLKAIASFERTLTSNHTPFDRYINGDINALSASQKRGFNLFRSGRTRCFECHGIPTFANRDFKIVGVPEIPGHERDLGRFDVTKGEGNKFAFKVPTLRNVVLNAPYMHNGRFKTIDEVLDFYAAGGGPGVGFSEPRVDDKVQSYTISAEEKSDMTAFLYALVDESRLPKFPERVPSGLSVVPRLSNAARDLIAKHNTGASSGESVSRQPQTLTVKNGESIQAAVAGAKPGDTIEVLPGIYREEIYVDLDRITLRGRSGEDGAKPILEGDRKLSDAVIATGSDFVIDGFEVRNYIANGVVAQNARNVTFRNLKLNNTGLYGVYPVSCSGVVIENCVATGIADAALYVGQSRDIVVRDCEAYNNVTGIEIENSINAVVENNHVHDNTGGVLVFILPNNPSKAGKDCVVRNNRILNNNHPNFAKPNSIVANVPPGTGVLIMAADSTEVTGNEIRGNDCYGVGVFSLEVAFPAGTAFDVGPIPENTFVHGNVYSDNGRNPAGAVVRAGLKGADLVWDLSGWSNRWDEQAATNSTPLISADWPQFARRAYWRGLQFMKTYL